MRSRFKLPGINHVMQTCSRFLRIKIRRTAHEAFIIAMSAGFGMSIVDQVHGACPFGCGDISGDASVGDDDFARFADCVGQLPASSADCACSDLDGSGSIDLRDFALLSLVYGQTSDESPPTCTGQVGSTADLSAYRPQHGAAYFPFTKSAVSDVDEDDPSLGPGIRINAPGDNDPAGEDDLIELILAVSPAGAQLALRRDHPALRVWTTRDKTSGTEIAFINDKTGALPIASMQTQITLWAEWAEATAGVGALFVEPLSTPVIKDAVTFHTFDHIVVALGGEGQVPVTPVDTNAGTFVVANDLYEAGFDVHMYDEDVVSADGSGAAYDETVTAIRDRGVSEVAVYGYSHGGGSTYDLADRLDVNRAAIGVFEIRYTSYVDSVSNNSDVDTGQELRRPPSAGFHLNHYQHGSFFEDLGLDGGPVPNSNPPPTGLDVETTPWGATSTHFQVDDFIQVRDLIVSSLAGEVIP